MWNFVLMFPIILVKYDYDCGESWVKTQIIILLDSDISAAPPRVLLNSIFSELKEIVLKWKIVQNYKTSWNSSKFIDIYNIIIELNTRDDICILSAMNLQEILLFLIFHSF